MTADDLASQLEALGLTAAELASITGERLTRINRWLGASEAIPMWLDVLTATWSQFPETLEVAKAFANPGQEGVS